MDISTLFVKKIEIATILLLNLIFGGYLHQIGRYFHLMRIVFIQVEITARFHQKPLFKTRWIRVVPNKILQCS